MQQAPISHLSYTFAVVELLSCVRLFATPWTVACEAPLSMGFPRHESWSGRHFLLQGVFLTQGLNLSFLHWWMDSEPPGEPMLYIVVFISQPSNLSLPTPSYIIIIIVSYQDSK